MSVGCPARVRNNVAPVQLVTGRPEDRIALYCGAQDCAIVSQLAHKVCHLVHNLEPPVPIAGGQSSVTARGFVDSVASGQLGIEIWFCLPIRLEWESDCDTGRVAAPNLKLIQAAKDAFDSPGQEQPWDISLALRIGQDGGKFVLHAQYLDLNLPQIIPKAFIEFPKQV